MPALGAATTATTIPEIAEAAGIAVETVYAAVGKKPSLFQLLVEAAISGSDRAVPAEECDYVRAIRKEVDAARKLQLYAAALRRIQPRLAQRGWSLNAFERWLGDAWIRLLLAP